jgi:hypothetical protein
MSAAWPAVARSSRELPGQRAMRAASTAARSSHGFVVPRVQLQALALAEGVEGAGEEVDQLDGDVGRALAQRLEAEGEAAQAKQEGLAEAAAGDGSVEVGVRGRDDADIDGADAAADRLDLALLERAQELDLQGIAASPISSRKSVPPLAWTK